MVNPSVHCADNTKMAGDFQSSPTEGGGDTSTRAGAQRRHSRDLVTEGLVAYALALALAVTPAAGPNRFVLAALIVAVQTALFAIQRRVSVPWVDQLGATLLVQHLLLVAGPVIAPEVYVPAALVAFWSLGTNLAYLPARWAVPQLLLAPAVAAAAPLVHNLDSATVIVPAAIVLGLQSALNRDRSQVIASKQIEKLERERGEAEATAETAQREAGQDDLTLLANRRALKARIEKIGEAQRAGDAAEVGLLLVDLNNFKEINDTLGHDYGDQVLTTIAQRFAGLGDSVDMVARLGGDEFAIVVEGDQSAVDDIAQSLKQIWSRPLMIDGRRTEIRGATGLAHTSTTAPADLLRMADIAMYRAKDTGAASAWFRSEENPHSQRRLRLINELPGAIGRGEVVAWYQPQVRLGTGEVIGAEALARWEHPELGVIGASELFEALRIVGMHEALTRTIAEQAIATTSRRNPPVPISINVTMGELHTTAVTEHLESLMAVHGLPAECLTVELVEHGDNHGRRATDGMPVGLQHLVDLGVGLSLDDFGTAHSSMSRLRRLGVSEIKIDREFVSRVTHSKEAAIITALVVLAEQLGLRLVAEGVEDSTQRDTLLAAGVTIGQGYLFAKPAPSLPVAVSLQI
jgi:diguanylate cyclase (GGDEF)-like protein